MRRSCTNSFVVVKLEYFSARPIPRRYERVLLRCYACVDVVVDAERSEDHQGHSTGTRLGNQVFCTVEARFIRALTFWSFEAIRENFGGMYISA